MKNASEKIFTRSERRASKHAKQEQSNSAISDREARANHITNWDEAKILGKEHNKKAREIKEAIEIRRRGTKTLNRMDGTYLLSHIYDPLIKRPNNAGKEATSREKSISRHAGSDGHSDEVSRRSETKY